MSNTTVLPTAPALDSILCNEKLNQRPSRPADYETESRALISLAQTLADSPQTILQTLADTILEVCRCGSAGVSLLTVDGKRFYWPAIAGVWTPHVGGGTPRDFGPCGDVLDRNSPLLFSHPERRYTYLQPVTPLVEEALLVPFYLQDEAVGTIWAIIHDDQQGTRRFDNEDLRMLISLSTFASAAYQAIKHLHAIGEHVDERLDAAQGLREINGALLISSVKQHELAELVEKAHAVVRDSEERFRTLFDLCPVAIYSCDTSGLIQKFNRRAVDLWGRTPALGDPDDRFCGSFKMFCPDGSLMPHEQCPMADVLSGKVPDARDAQAIIERPDGSRITVVVNIRPLKNQRGEVTEAINCFYDITEIFDMQTKLQDQAKALAELHRRKDEFLAMLSHELRNPLAPISNAVLLLRLHKHEDELQRQARTIIERQVGQLARLVDDLLEISRITSGRIHLRQELITLNGIVENAVETVRPLINQRRHALTISLPSRSIWVYADAARAEQVVVNLLTNAAKYTADGGQIWLALEQQEEEAVLRVRDTGVGIAPDLLPRIFDLFTQAERSLDRSQGGLGIGLCLVQRLVELHGGRVEATSTLGEGSEFVVRLPVKVTFEAAAPLKFDEIIGTTRSSLRVLVVDDNVDAAETLAMLLKASGHDVQTAFDGPTTVEVAMKFHPNVVLLDLGLPGLDGFEVAKRLRREANLGGVVLIAMTGYGQESDRRRSYDAGFDHHLVKPADFSEVQQILATVSEKAT